MEKRSRYFVYRSSCENCSLLRDYVSSSDNSLPTFRNNLSVPSSTVKNPSCHEITRKSAFLIYFAAEAWNYSFFTWIWPIGCLKNWWPFIVLQVYFVFGTKLVYVDNQWGNVCTIQKKGVKYWTRKTNLIITNTGTKTEGGKKFECIRLYLIIWNGP